MKQIKIHIIGGDRWALGTECRLARKALEKFAKIVDSPDEADFLHTVDVENSASLIHQGILRPEVPIIGAINNHPSRLTEWPGFIETSQKYMYLVPQSTLAARDMDRLGILYSGQTRIISDSASYHEVIPHSPELVALRHKYQIPNDKYLIGLLQRDSEGRNLRVAKRQKGPDVFLALMITLQKRCGKDRFHVLLGGPRRHWLRSKLREYDIPYTFVGTLMEEDDYPANILDKPTMCLLYNLLDLYVIPTRWEGAPRQVFDVLECGRKIISTSVGIVPDILDTETLFSSVEQAVELITRDIEENFLQGFIEPQQQQVERYHSIESVAELWRQVYENIISLELQNQHLQQGSPGRRKKALLKRLGTKCIVAAKRHTKHLYRQIRPLTVSFVVGGDSGQEGLFALRDDLADHVNIKSEHDSADVVIAAGDISFLSPQLVSGRKCLLLLDEACARGLEDLSGQQRQNLITFSKSADTTVVSSHQMLTMFSNASIYLRNPVVVPTWVYGLERKTLSTSCSNLLVIVDSIEQVTSLGLLTLTEQFDCTMVEMKGSTERQTAPTIIEALQECCAVVLFCSEPTQGQLRKFVAAGLPIVFPREKDEWTKDLGFHGVPFERGTELVPLVQRVLESRGGYNEILTIPYREDVINTLVSILHHYGN